MTPALLSLICSIISFVALVLLVILVFKNKPFAEKVDNALKTAKKAADAADTLLRVTPAGPVIHVVDEAIQAAEIGVKFAEQLYISGNAVDRKAEATKYVTSTLAELGVQVTPQLSGIIDGAIEAAVFTLPTTPTIQAAPAAQETASAGNEAPAAK